MKKNKFFSGLNWTMLALALMALLAFIGYKAKADLTAPPKSVEQAYFAQKNMLVNPGFELGKTKWTASAGSFTITTTTANLATGARGGEFDASAASQTITSTSTAIPAGFYGRNGIAYCSFKTTATDYTIGAYDGSNLLNSTTVPSSSTFTRVSTNFPFPVSGSLSLRITSGSDAAALDFDDCYLGIADNVYDVSQATFIGSAHYATTGSCTWSRTNTALGAFSTAASCPSPTVDLNPGPGTIQTTDADLPRFTVNNLPPGNYEVIISLNAYSAGAGNLGYQINDGTTSDGLVGLTPTSSTSSVVTIAAHFTYTTTANRTFEVQGSASTSSVQILNGSDKQQTNFAIKRFPSINETAWRADQQNWFVAAEFSGANPSLGTSNVSSYTEISDAGLTLTPVTGSAAVGVMCSTTNAATAPSSGATTCAAGSESVGVNFSVPLPGWYEVCFDASHRVEVDTAEVVRTTFQVIETPTAAQTLTQECGPKLQSGGTGMTIATGTAQQVNTPGRYCGQCNFSTSGIHGVRLMYEQNISGTPNESILFADANTSNGQRVIRVSAKPILQSMNVPILIHSVISDSSGVEKVTRAKINCSSSASVTSQSGTWISSIGNVSSGACALTIAAGVFSASPVCTATIAETSTGNIFEFEAVVTSATAVSIRNQFVTNGSSTVSNGTNTNINVICMGPK